MTADSLMPFVKGHGAGNDFVVVDDPDGRFDLSARQVAALCDRHRGIGADGLLRVTERDGLPFMDYRNADGSIAEMCGNGVRVFVAYLESVGRVDTSRPVDVATRAGIRHVSAVEGGFEVDMGPVRLGDQVDVTVAGRWHRAVAVDVGNPHAVVVIDDDLDGIALADGTQVPPATFPAGANVEIVDTRFDRVRVRVLERGVGETLACGTGACAVAAVIAPDAVSHIELPGGTLTVRLGGGRALLSGPAVLVAHGRVDLRALAGAR